MGEDDQGVGCEGRLAAIVKRGLDPIPSRPERFGEFIRSEIAKYAKIVKDAQIKID